MGILSAGILVLILGAAAYAFYWGANIDDLQSVTAATSSAPQTSRTIDYVRKNTNYQFLRVMNVVGAAMVAAMFVIWGVRLIGAKLGSDATMWGWAFLIFGPLGALVEFHATRLVIDVADAVILRSKP